MIPCDHHIDKAIREGRLVIDPLPSEDQYQSSAVDLRIGDDVRIWKKSLKARGTGHSIDIDDIELSDLLDFTDALKPNGNGIVVAPPGLFLLALTREYVYLPAKSKLAARVEGRSKMARLGMTAHITAPTIHAGFRGRTALEIVNHGPFEIKVRPNHSRLCQLIIEEVSAIPKRKGSSSFDRQTTVLGTPESR
jgi:dCTP deaminase